MNHVKVSRDDAREEIILSNEKYDVLYIGGTTSIKGFNTVLSSIENLDKDTCVMVLGNEIGEIW